MMKTYFLSKISLETRQSLLLKAQLLPCALRTFFKSRLLLFKQKDEVLHSKHIWIIWLEFLTILNIFKE